MHYFSTQTAISTLLHVRNLSVDRKDLKFPSNDNRAVDREVAKIYDKFHNFRNWSHADDSDVNVVYKGLSLTYPRAVTGSCPLGLQMPSILQSSLSIWHDALVSAPASRLSRLRSRGPSLRLCHWLVILGFQAQLHGRPLTYLRHLKRWWNPQPPQCWHTKETMHID